MSFGILSVPTLENVSSTAIHDIGIGGTGPAFVGEGGSLGSTKKCMDVHSRYIPQGVHYVPGPDECTVCICDDGLPKWCKAVMCSPPQGCQSFRILGKSCCDFICLDDRLPGKTGGPFGPVDITDVVPKIVIAAVTAMLSLSLLFFLIHRLRQKQIQGRINSAEARRSAQMCDECDDTRSLDYSMDYFERGTSQSIYPPHYLAWHWWKPPSSYIPPRGEAPPPYEEAICCNSNCLPMTVAPTSNNNRQQTTTTGRTATSLTNTNTTFLTNENINPKNKQKSPKTITKLNDDQPQIGCSDAADGDVSNSSSSEPQPGPSTRLNETDQDITDGSVSTNDINSGRSANANQGANSELFQRSCINTAILPSYDDTFPLHHGREYFRHSLTLPRRPGFLQDGDGTVLCMGQEGARRNQRYSLQFNVVDWSSSSSTLSLSTPNSANELELRLPRSSSSSSDSSNNTQSM